MIIKRGQNDLKYYDSLRLSVPDDPLSWSHSWRGDSGPEIPHFLSVLFKSCAYLSSDHLLHELMPDVWFKRPRTKLPLACSATRTRENYDSSWTLLSQPPCFKILTFFVKLIAIPIGSFASRICSSEPTDFFWYMRYVRVACHNRGFTWHFTSPNIVEQITSYTWWITNFKWSCFREHWKMIGSKRCLFHHIFSRRAPNPPADPFSFSIPMLCTPSSNPNCPKDLVRTISRFLIGFSRISSNEYDRLPLKCYPIFWQTLFPYLQLISRVFLARICKRRNGDESRICWVWYDVPRTAGYYPSVAYIISQVAFLRSLLVAFLFLCPYGFWS